MSLNEMALSVVAISSIGGGAVALNEMHVASEDFDKYIEQQLVSDERDYVLEVKNDIRNIKAALIKDPGEEYLIEELADLTDELCEIRPEDRLCEDED